MIEYFPEAKEKERYVADAIIKYIFVNWNCRTLIIEISNKAMLVHVIICLQTGDKSFLISLITQFGEAYVHHRALIW